MQSITIALLHIIVHPLELYIVIEFTSQYYRILFCDYQDLLHHSCFCAIQKPSSYIFMCLQKFTLGEYHLVMFRNMPTLLRFSCFDICHLVEE